MVDHKKERYVYPLASLQGKVPFAPDWFVEALACLPRQQTLRVRGAQICYQEWPKTESAPILEEKNREWEEKNKKPEEENKKSPQSLLRSGTEHTSDSEREENDSGREENHLKPERKERKNKKRQHPFLILVHGGYAHKNWWDFIAPYYAGDFTVIAVTLSGMGDSDWRKTYTLDLHMEEVRAVLEAKGLFHPQSASDLAASVIVGHSYGGYVVFRLLQRLQAEFTQSLSLKKPASKQASLQRQNIEKQENVLPVGILVDTPLLSMISSRNHASNTGTKRSLRKFQNLEEGLSCFRLAPSQTCENLFLLDYIARKSLKPEAEGWKWKFDPDLFYHYKKPEISSKDLHIGDQTRIGFMRGCNSALVETSCWQNLKKYFLSQNNHQKHKILFSEVTAAQHHVFLDQPVSFMKTLSDMIANSLQI